VATVRTDDNADTRFEALVKDRDTLRVEVTRLREAIEALQAKHETGIEGVRGELENSRAEKTHAEELGRVNTIKAQLGERLKADAVRCHTKRARRRTKAVVPNVSEIREEANYDF
jgi:uncharacterized protein with von Willebrand factor type A (vWA) domain